MTLLEKASQHCLPFSCLLFALFSSPNEASPREEKEELKIYSIIDDDRCLPGLEHSIRMFFAPQAPLVVLSGDLHDWKAC
jgi:hypothetical protein